MSAYSGASNTGTNLTRSVAAEGEYSEEQYKRLRRKIDRYLLPLMWLCYGIQQSDKTALGTQAIFGLRQDTGLHGQQYSWLTTIFCTSSKVPQEDISSHVFQISST